MFNLLIVDDEPLTREFITTQISSIDSEWVAAGAARDGVEALSFLQNHTVDLVITDIKMPVMDGLALCEKIKQQNPGQEIVILSGYDEFSYAQEAMKHQVHGYLLKPIKIPALQEILNEIAKKLTQKSKQETALHALQSLSTDYQSHLCKSYLKAIIENLHTEIKVLHPMIYQLKMDLMQSLGVILVLRLDEEAIFAQKLPAEDFPIFRYVLFQSVEEAIGDDETAYAVLDSQENVVVYFTGDSESDLEQKCSDAFSKVSDFLFAKTGLTVTGFIGSSSSNILEMYNSYKDAMRIYTMWATHGDHALYNSRMADSSVLNTLCDTEKICTSLGISFLNEDKANLPLAVKNLIDTMQNFTRDAIVRYGLLVLQYLMFYKADFTAEERLGFFRKMEALVDKLGSSVSPDGVFDFFIALILSAWGKAPEDSEAPGTQKLVELTKEFIYSHFAEPITLSQIADHINVSPNYLSKVFHESVGESYIKFTTRIRMEYAAKLLKADPSERIFVIAEKSGYCNLKHFNFVFKEYYNMTPTEYQKTSQK